MDDWWSVPKDICLPNATSLLRKGPPALLNLKVIIEMSDAPTVVDDAEGLEPEEVVDEVDDADKDVDMEGEDKAEEVSQCDEEEPANGNEEPAEADNDPNDPDAEINGEGKPSMKLTLMKEKSMNAHQDSDLEDQEIELSSAHRAEALDVIASIEL